MPKIRMIADDLTGANANCSLMKKIGLSAATVLNCDADLPKDFDVLALTTDSRAFEPEEAYDSVHQALNKVLEEDIELYCKRIDSTLRGNLGAEINAFFDVLGEDYLGIAVPAYPATGRLVVNGQMFVNGNLLINSDAGRDTKTPVTSSQVIDLFRKDLAYPAENIYVHEIEKGVANLTQLIKEKYQSGSWLLVFDGLIDQHLEIIAKAILQSGLKFFTVDPGPFSLEVSNQRLDFENLLNKVLLVVGSVTETTTNQINELLALNPHVQVVNVAADKLALEDQRNKEIEDAVQKSLKLLTEHDILLITSSPYKEGESKLDLLSIAKEEGLHIDDISIRISSGLAEIAKTIVLTDFSFAGAFMSGGDITVAFAEYMESQGLEIREEVIPLAAYGRLIGGLRPDLRVISKGGMVGDLDAMCICLDKLMQVSTD